MEKTVVGYKLVENHNNGYYSFFLMKKITEVMEWNDEFVYYPEDSEFYGFCAFASLKDAKRVLSYYSVNAVILKVKLSNVVGSFSTYEMAINQAPVKVILARRQEIIGEV